MRHVFIIFIALALFSTAHAQSMTVDTVTWHIDKIKILDNDSLQNYSCKIITYGDDKIMWLQNADSYLTEFSVNSVEGNWTDVSQNGSIVFHVAFATKTGTVEFSKSPSTVSVTMNFMENGVSIFPWLYLVTKISNP